MPLATKRTGPEWRGFKEEQGPGTALNEGNPDPQSRAWGKNEWREAETHPASSTREGHRGETEIDCSAERRRFNRLGAHWGERQWRPVIGRKVEGQLEGIRNPKTTGGNSFPFKEPRDVEGSHSGAGSEDWNMGLLRLTFHQKTTWHSETYCLIVSMPVSAESPLDCRDRTLNW